MAKLQWDLLGDRLYETGVDRGVLFVQNADGTYSKGVVWNGLVSFSENPTGAEPNPQYADNIKYLNLTSAEELEGSLEAFSYPDEFAICDGSAELKPGVHVGQQARKSFGFAYRSLIGNDTAGTDYGYKIHLIYGARASVSEKAYNTVNDSPEAMTMSWDITTVPVQVTGFKPTASITIDSTKVDATELAALEKILYGDELIESSLPLPDAVAALFTVVAG